MRLAAGVLDGPAVPVRVAEAHELPAGRGERLGDLDSPFGELLVRGVDVVDDELQALHRARLLLREPLADGDRAGRTRRGPLPEPQPVPHPVGTNGLETAPPLE